MATSKVIREWLAEYKVLSKEEFHSYAASIRHNGELIAGLHALFDTHPDTEVLDPICHQLFEFYRSRKDELQRFSLELLPSLVWLYLSFISRGEKSKCGGVEAFLLSVYNLETCNPDGSPKVKLFRVPVLSKASIYHEPQALSTSPLSESTLRRFNAEQSEHRDGPHPQFEAVNGQNRHSILAYLIQCYHNNISVLSARSHRIFCKMCSRIVTTGFHTLIPDDEDDLVRTTATLHEAARRINQIGDIDADRRLSQTAGLDPAKRINQTGELDPRISVSPALLIDMLTCLYFIMFNGQAGPGAQAVVDIHYRACCELLPDVLLVTNAIRNSLRENPSGQPDDGPIGLSLALSPASSNYTLSKTAITNASFRAKKLPDDIPVQPDESGKLPTISEDDTSSKTKTSKTKQAKKDKTGDRSKTKESRTNSGMNNSIISISDQSSDNLTVAVIKGQQRNSVDSIEMAGFIKTKETTSNKSRDSIDGGSSPFVAKHVTASSAKTGSGMKTSISNKDIKNAKQTSGHSRNLSGDSAASENQSTDL